MVVWVENFTASQWTVWHEYFENFSIIDILIVKLGFFNRPQCKPL